MFNNSMYQPNFYPYQNFMGNIAPRRGLTSLLRGHSINWSNILNNTQKTLNVINQAIPVYYQMKPIYNNAKTMLRMVSALKDDDKLSNSANQTTINATQNKKETSQEGPVFFL